MLWEDPRMGDCTKARELFVTKHAREITKDQAPEKTIIHTLPIGQFYDADNYLNSPRGPTLCGPSL